jgi:hypothetical protein
VRAGPGARAGGVEAMGQNLLSTIFGTVSLAVLLLVPGIAAFGTWVALRGQLGRAAYGVALVVCLTGMVGELALLVRWLGRIFERTDPASTGEA